MAQINKPTDYFDTSTWTATTSAISNLNFSPDWVWIKSTDSGNTQILFDTIRGANKRLSSSSTAAESTRTDELMSFDSNGYTLGSSGNTNDTNPFNASYVGWSWRGSDSSAVSNTDGSITSTVSVNTTSGFSIVSYTGTGSNATVGHGLGVTPKMFIIKNRSDGTQFWPVYHASLSGADQYLVLDQAVSAQPGSAIFNSTAPTSSVFSVGGHGTTNGSGNNMIAYCFAEKKGFSKFGSYTSNNSSNGPFIYCGFKPAFLLLKNITTGNTSWELYDNKRTPNNVANLFLRPNTNEANISSDRLDILSNGFKLRQVGDTNANSDTIIYMAFAENPLVGTNNIPAVAR